MLDIPENDYNFVKKIAYKYYLRSSYFIELDDLIQEGMLAYLQCVGAYNKDKNNFYMGYAYLRVSGAIKDFVGKNSPKGPSTVRPNSGRVSTREIVNFSVAGIDENLLEDTKVPSAYDELNRWECRDQFDLYLAGLTVFEQKILYDYFIVQDSMTKVAFRYSTSRIKVKKIVTAAILYLKEFYKVE